MRSALTVTTLVAKGLVDASFEYHVIAAKQNGIMAPEMAAMLTHIAFYAGWPNAWAAFRVAVKVYAHNPQGLEEPEAHGGLRHAFGAVKRWCVDKLHSVEAQLVIQLDDALEARTRMHGRWDCGS